MQFMPLCFASVHVVHVRVVSTRQVQGWVEATLAVLAKPFHAEVSVVRAKCGLFESTCFFWPKGTDK